MLNKWYYAAIFVVFILLVVIIIWYKQREEFPGIIKVGIIHSLTGPTAVFEKQIVDTTLMAIEEINLDRGVLGKKLVPLVADGKSDPQVFATESERLITQEKVAVLFSGGSSLSRKKIKLIVEKYNSLLFYPHRNEGLEISQNIVYTGSTSNQQIIPAVIWCMQNLGKYFFLVGNNLSDQNFIAEKATRQIIKDLIYAYNGTIVGEESVSPINTNINEIIKHINKTQPDVIINILEGEINGRFFSALRDQGISSDRIPTMSLNITELELAAFRIDAMIGDYGAQSYFQSLNTPTNRSFIERFKRRFGPHRLISNAMENAYTGVYFWRNAVLRAQTTDINTVRALLSEETLVAPEGVISVDKNNLHTWKPVLIGKIFPNKQFGIVYNSNSTTKPLPYPPFRSKEQWEHLMDQWNNELAGR